jgi:acyl dehydratase
MDWLDCVHRDIANQRADFLKKLARDLVCRHDVLVLEDLRIRNMVRNHHLAKSIFDRGWSSLPASPSVAIGAMLPVLTKHVTFEQMTVFSFSTRSIHIDRDSALENGLESPIAQGLMSTCYLSEMLVNFVGAEWFESGWTSHAFIKSVSAGDTITVHGRVQEKRADANGTRLLLDLWSSNQKGDMTTVGRASALVTSQS